MGGVYGRGDPKGERSGQHQDSSVVSSVVPQASVNDLDELNGIGPKYRKLLEKAEVQSRHEMSGYAPEVLRAALSSVNEKEQITKRPPTLTQVNEWISLANISVD